MSTISANPDASNAQSPSDQGDLLIAEHLEAVRAAIWRSLLLGSILRLLAGVLIFFFAFAVIDQWILNVSPLWRLILGTSAVASAVTWTIKRIIPLIRQRISREYAAFSIEMEAPELQHSLTSYVTLRDDREAPGIRGIVIRSIGSRAARFLTNTGMTMPRESGGSFQWSMIVIALSALFAIYAIASPKNTLQSVRRLATPLAAIEAPTRTQIEEVTPGNAEALFGRPLKITAKIRGLSINDQAFVEFAASRGSNQFAMPKSDESGKYETIIPGDWITDDFTYHVVAGDSRSGPFEVTIRDLPAVVVNQVSYSPPAYTQLSRRVSNSGAIEGPEGTVVTVTATTNRKIAKGRIEFNPRTIQGQTSATAGFAPVEVSEDGLTLTATWNLQSTVRGGTQATIDSYRIHVWDETDVENTDPVIYPIRVINDLPPEVRIAVPEKSPKDVPLGTQQTIEVRSVDPDYGLTTVDLQIRRGTSIVKTIPLLNDEIGRRGNHVAAYRFRPDTLGLRSGDLVTVEAIARDNRYDVLAQKTAANRTVSEPVELKITPSPSEPQTPDGDGLQPKDNRPATSNQSNDGGQGDQGQAAGGGGAGGESEKGQGTGGQGEGAGQSTSENQPDPENQSQPNSGQGKGSGGESSENNNNPENNRDNGSGGDSQDSSQENPGDSRQSSGGDTEGQENNSEASDTNESPPGDNPASGSPSPDTGSDSGTSGDNTLPRNGENPQQQTPEQSPTDSGNEQNADERSGTPLDSQETDGAESQNDQQDSQGAGGDSQSDSRNSSNDSRAKSETPPPPASSDGEAFERIRDYLNERSRETPSQRPNSAPQDGNKEPTEDQQSEGKEQEDATSTPESKPSPQSSDEPTGSQQNSTNSDAASGAREGGKQSPNGNDKPLDASQPNGSSNDSSAGDSPSENSQDGASGEEPEGKAASNGSSEQTSEQASEQGDPSKDSNQNESQQNPKEGSGAEPGESRGESEEGSENQGGQDSTEENRSGENSSGNEDGKQGDQGKNGQPGSEASPDSTNSNDPTGEDPSDSQPAGGSSSDNQSNSSQGKESKSNASQSPNGDPTGGNSGGSFGEGERGKDAAPPADKIDLDAAKKATDLVLDAIQHQRENPDQALLDELGWTPEQLRRFIDRWQGVKKLGEQTDPQSRQQFEEALQSLGLRPAGVSTERRSLDARQDRLNEIRDTGTRMQPPPQFRDAIEAFRRGVNK